MDFQLPSFSIISVFLLFMFMSIKYMKISTAKNSIQKLPPRPWGLPLLGNMHQLVGLAKHRILRDLARKYGPLMHLQLGEVSTVIVSSPEIAREVMKTHDIIFINRPRLLASGILSYDFTDIVFSPYGDYWRHLRKLCVMELLSSKRVQSFQSIREEEVLTFIGSIFANKLSPINLSRKIFSLTGAIVTRAAFSERSKQQEKFNSLVDEGVQLAAGFCIADMFPSVKLLEVITRIKPRMETIHKEIDEILEAILDEHKQKKRAETVEKEEKADVVDILLNVQKDGDQEASLSDNNIKAVLFDIFSAGTETSSAVVEWAMAEMIKNPKVMKRAQAEVREVFNEAKTVKESGLHQLEYLKAVIKETMRLHPSAPLSVPRESSEACEINGYRIPAKTRLIVNAWAISRDPRYWTEAENFAPERFLNSKVDYQGTDFEFIPFGAGRRMCPGMAFAVANIELPLAQLLYHFDWKVPGGRKQGEELDMSETFGVTMRRKHDLYLIPFPYEPSTLK